MVAGREAGHLPIVEPMTSELELADWRRRVAALYAELRADPVPGAERAAAFRAARDALFASHSQSPVPEAERAAFAGLAYWPVDPAWRLMARLESDPEPIAALPVSSGEAFAFSRIGWVSADAPSGSLRLAVYWLAGYGGGVFLPFRDATSGATSYGGGRYLWDSVKGADLGSVDDELVLDFNYAYHPSCVYDPGWSCPLAPRDNWLAIPVEAGERLSGDQLDRDRLGEAAS
jgi:uncharacterized protein (DUF1684 family)